MNCSKCRIREDCMRYPIYEGRDIGEAFKEMDVKMKYTIDDRKNIYRGFAKRCKKEIKKRIEKSHYGAYLLDIASLYPVIEKRLLGGD